MVEASKLCMPGTQAPIFKHPHDSFGLKEVLVNWGLSPWRHQFCYHNHEFWGSCLTYYTFQNTLLAFSFINLRASFRLKKVLENRGLASSLLLPQPWIFGKLFNILHLWINVIGIFWYHLQGQLWGQEGAGNWSPAAKVPKAVKILTWIFGYFGKYTNT